jgi:nicotinate-nucleotide--dimethylbenzimidazole phosphoribosyltransferase
MMAYPSRHGQSRGYGPELADTPEQPEGGASPQDLDLEAQLDALLTRLEETDPQSVPADLRKHPPEPAEPVAETPKPEAVSQEAVSEEAVSEGVAAQEPVAQAADAEAAQPQPVTAGEPAIAQDATQDVMQDATHGAAQDVAQDTAQDGGQPSGQAGEAVINDEPQPVAATASDLLDQQIDDTIDAATAPADPGSDSAEPQTPAQPPEPAEAQAGSGSAGSLSEDDLASQIQGLLNEVQEKGVDAIPPGEPDGAPDPTAGAQAEAQTEAQADTPPAVDGVQATAAVDGAEAPPAMEAVEVKADPAQGAASAQDRDVPIDQIDEMLAKSAEQAIQQEAPPAPQVPGTDEVLAAQAEAEARDRLEAEARRGPEPTPVQPDPAGEAVAVEPQPVPIQGASAADVAKELDEDTQAPPAEPAPVSEAQPQAAAPVAVEQAAPAAVVVVKTGHLRKAERALRLVCGKVNRPLNRLSPEMRDTVGYIGVVTTGLALFIFVYGLLF